MLGSPVAEDRKSRWSVEMRRMRRIRNGREGWRCGVRGRICHCNYMQYKNTTVSILLVVIHFKKWPFRWTDNSNDSLVYPHWVSKQCNEEVKSPTWYMKMFRGLIFRGCAWPPFLAIIRWTPATFRACRQPQPITGKDAHVSLMQMKINK